MVLPETIQYASLLGVTIVFSAFALTIDKEGLKLVLKLTATICWFVMALTQFFFFGGSNVLAAPMVMLFLAFGIIFAFSTVTDWNTEKKDRIWKFGEE